MKTGTRILTIAVATGAVMHMFAPIAGAVELKFSHGSGPTHFVHKAAEKMAASLAASTSDRITMEVFPNHQLGEGSEVTEQVALGAEFVTISNAGALGEYLPDYGILQYPFLYGSYAEAEPLIKSDLFKEWSEGLAAQNLRVLCVFNFGIRDLYTVDRPVRSPADMQGLKVRVQPVPLYTELVRLSFGAAPTPLPWSEVYSALSQGVIDAAEAPPSAMLDQRHYETAKYFILTHHILDLSSMITSEATWQSLEESERGALQLAADTACSEMTAESEASYQASLDQLEEYGMTIIDDIDRAAFVEGAKGIQASFPEWTPGLYDRVQSILSAQ